MSTTSVLPPWRHVLAVVAHPDDESFGLGAVLSSFIDAGVEVSVLCLTRGEASTLHGVDGELHEVRAAELRAAGAVLGIGSVGLRDYPDGGLATVPLDTLVREIDAFTAEHPADGLVVFDPSGITGHPDHQQATSAAHAYARANGIGVLAWTLPEDVAIALGDETGAAFTGQGPGDIDITIRVDRDTQTRAVACHPSQAVPGSVLWRRLALLGPWEHLRWLHHANRSNDTVTPPLPQVTETKEEHP